MPSPCTVTLPLWRCIFCGSSDLRATPELGPADAAALPAAPEEFLGWLLRCLHCHREYHLDVA